MHWFGRNKFNSDTLKLKKKIIKEKWKNRYNKINKWKKTYA